MALSDRPRLSYHAAHDHSTPFWVSHTCFFLAAVLFVPTVVALARMVHPSHPKAAFWACVLSLMGFVGWGALDGIDYMAWVAGKQGAWKGRRAWPTSRRPWPVPVS